MPERKRRMRAVKMGLAMEAQPTAVYEEGLGRRKEEKNDGKMI